MEASKKNRYSICVVGAGYVGMSLGVLLAKENNVIFLDLDDKKVDQINKGKSTVLDNDIENHIRDENLNITATTSSNKSLAKADFIIVATPTNFDDSKNAFDTSSVDSVVEESILLNENALIVIKSTIPIGHTKFLQKKFKSDRIIFSPEFLREGSALYDNLNPSRIIIGDKLNNDSKVFANLLLSSAVKSDVEIIYTGPSEAESIKLFSNSYLAMRVSYFNELDSFAMKNNLSTKDIINGVCLDDRIGKDYNNPSFGYGGYCLPKDSKQLLTHFSKLPQNLIEAIVLSNETRKDFITQNILNKKIKTVGVFRLIMKNNSDNYRSSAIIGIIDRILSNDTKVIIYEPSFTNMKFKNCELVRDLDDFKKRSDIIIANRNDDSLSDVSFKCFTRDIFGEN